MVEHEASRSKSDKTIIGTQLSINIRRVNSEQNGMLTHAEEMSVRNQEQGIIERIYRQESLKGMQNQQQMILNNQELVLGFPPTLVSQPVSSTLVVASTGKR